MTGQDIGDFLIQVTA